MDLNSVLKLLKAVNETEFSKFEMTDKDFSIRLEKNTGTFVEVAPAAPMQVAAPPAQAAVQDVGAAAEEKGSGVPNAKDILSPLVGIFHPLKTPVKIGDKLKKGDAICMIEAMKLMNEITMPDDGEIVWIAAEDGDTVEFSQLLFSYK